MFHIHVTNLRWTHLQNTNSKGSCFLQELIRLKEEHHFPCRLERIQVTNEEGTFHFPVIEQLQFELRWGAGLLEKKVQSPTKSYTRLQGGINSEDCSRCLYFKATLSDRKHSLKIALAQHPH